MIKTSNYDLIVVEGSDKVNLLTQMNPNTEKIDEVMKTNEKSGVQVATELLSGTVHAITRTVKSASMFKFTAVSNYKLGDTFTVDGKQVTALLTSGEALGTGAYIIGSEVLCSLKDTLLTVYTQSGTVKLAEDSKKLGGNLPEYYAKESDLNRKIDVTSSKAINLINDGSVFLYSKVGINITVFGYGSVKTKIDTNYILCSGFPIPIAGNGVLNVVNLSKNNSGTCLINKSGQLVAVEPILVDIGDEFSISGIYIANN